MKRVPKREPLDAAGVRLKVGDSITSTVGYHAEEHRGKVIEVIRQVCIAVRHDEGCCVPPLNARRPFTTTCAAKLWRKSP
jgi:hypothetical protein